MPSQYLPEPWGAPRLYKGVNGGAIWRGQEPATWADIRVLLEAAGRSDLNPFSTEGMKYYDHHTLCGKADKENWTTYYEEMTARDAARNPWLRFKRWVGW